MSIMISFRGAFDKRRFQFLRRTRIAVGADIACGIGVGLVAIGTLLVPIQNRRASHRFAAMQWRDQVPDTTLVIVMSM